MRSTIRTATQVKDETTAGPVASSVTPSATNEDASERLALILTSLDDDKAEDVLTIDLRGKSSLADYMVIASGRSNRHVASVCEKLIERLKAVDGSAPRSEGVSNGDWALIDANDVIVHVFRPEVRAFYALEKMWAPAEVVAAREAREAEAAKEARHDPSDASVDAD